MFAPFERLGAEQTTVEGTGVGLTLAKRVIEAMGGAIGFDSKVGVGIDVLDRARRRATSPLKWPKQGPEQVEPTVGFRPAGSFTSRTIPANLDLPRAGARTAPGRGARSRDGGPGRAAARGGEPPEPRPPRRAPSRTWRASTCSAASTPTR